MLLHVYRAGGNDLFCGPARIMTHHQDHSPSQHAGYGRIGIGRVLDFDWAVM